MWLLRRKAVGSNNDGEVLPSSTATMRRIEITVERQTVTRLSRGTSPLQQETVDPQAGLQDTGERR